MATISANPSCNGMVRSNNHCAILNLPDCILIQILSYLTSDHGIDIDSIYNIQLVCSKLFQLQNSSDLWREVSLTNGNHSLKPGAFRFIKKWPSGTEGTLLEVYCKPLQQKLALRRSRCNPALDEMNLPFYVVAEIRNLKALSHPNIASIMAATLQGSKLSLLYPWAPLTLLEVLRPSSPSGSINSLPESIALAFTRQLVSALHHCHRRGVTHRNIKPAHLLLEISPQTTYKTSSDDPNSPYDLEVLRHAKILIADFAISTYTDYSNHSSREEVSLADYTGQNYHRCPELLLGYDMRIEARYTSGDMWSVGCVLGEMLRGTVLFFGASQVDQLFKIFRARGLPKDPVFISQLVHFNPNMFPAWSEDFLDGLLPSNLTSASKTLLRKLLEIEPAHRLTAEQALNALAEISPTEQHDITATADPIDTLRKQYIPRLPSPLGTYQQMQLDQLLSYRHLETQRRNQTHPQLSHFLRNALDLSKSAWSHWRCQLANQSLNLVGTFTLAGVTSLRMICSSVDLFDRYSCQQILNAGHSSRKCLKDVQALVHEYDKLLAASRAYPTEKLTLQCQQLRQTIDIVITVALLGPQDAHIEILLSRPLSRLSAGCMALASKCDNRHPQSVHALIGLQADLNGAEDLDIEGDILRGTQFELHGPTLLDFVGLYLQLIPERRSVTAGEQSLGQPVEYSTFDMQNMLPNPLFAMTITLALAVIIEGPPDLNGEFPMSLVGACIVAHSLYSLRLVATYPRSLESLTGYSIESVDTRRCIHAVYSLHVALSTSVRCRNLLQRMMENPSRFIPLPMVFDEKG